MHLPESRFQTKEVDFSKLSDRLPMDPHFDWSGCDEPNQLTSPIFTWITNTHHQQKPVAAQKAPDNMLSDILHLGAFM